MFILTGFVQSAVLKSSFSIFNASLINNFLMEISSENVPIFWLSLNAVNKYKYYSDGGAVIR